MIFGQGLTALVGGFGKRGQIVVLRGGGVREAAVSAAEQERVLAARMQLGGLSAQFSLVGVLRCLRTFVVRPCAPCEDL